MRYHTVTKEAAAALLRIVLWAGVLACFVSCRDEELMPGTDTGGLIAFRIREREFPVAATRAASGNACDSSFTPVSGSVPLIVGGDTIEMGITAESNRDPIFAERPQPLTRGVPFGKDDDGKQVTAFHVTAFRDGSHGDGTYFEPKEVTVNEGIARTGMYWPAGKLSFCAYYVLGLNSQQAVKDDLYGQDVATEPGECTFMMIPQDIGDNSEIVLKFSLGEDEREYTFSKRLKEIEALKPAGSGTAKLLPDTRYTFTIGLNGDVDIEVDDKVEGMTKSDVTIQNTGISTGYIRAAIVGYWANESGSVMGAWQETDGNFVGLAGENWGKGDDGFWDYTEPGKHYEYTKPLFTSYALNESAVTTHPRQHLVLDVVAQIVIEDEREKAKWQREFNK